MPLLSVLTAAYAPVASFLPQTAASILDQQLPPGWELEWIVQEDGNSPELGSWLGPVERVRYGANHAQLGVAVTRNVALSRARGDLIQLLDHDDLLLPGALETLVPRFAEHPIHWTIGQADDLLPDGSRRGFPPALPFGIVEPGTVNTWAEQHDANWPIHCAALMVRASTLRALGGWAASPADDDIVMFSALWELTSGFHDPALTWLYRHHPDQAHRSTEWKARSELGRRIALQRLSALRESGIRMETGPRAERHPCDCEAGEKRSELRVGPPVKADLLSDRHDEGGMPEP
jgi:glycosyltransferase involved in cell wall biosynthesis